MGNQKKAIIVLTTASERTSGQGDGAKGLKYRPDLDARLRIAGAVELYKQESARGNDVYFIFSGGVTDKEMPALSSVMKDYFLHKYHNRLNIGSDRILEEDRSVDTTENAEFTKKVIEENKFEDYVVVANSYQRARAGDCFVLNGLERKTTSGEDLLSVKDERAKRLVRRFKMSSKSLKLYALNVILRGVLKVSPNLVRDYIHYKVDKKGRR